MSIRSYDIMGIPNKTSMKRNVVLSDNTSIICDAVNCYAEAEEEVQLSAGQYGKITFSFCNNCLSNFMDSEDGGS